MSVDPTLPLDASGIYRTPDDLSELRARAVRAGVAWLEVDTANVRDKSGLMSVLAHALQFPPTFGSNWDALADTLQDFSWHPASGYVLHFRNAAPLRAALGADWVTLVEILRTTARYSAQHRKFFIVLMDDAEDLPSWN
jgi:hypothetical protein